MVFRSDGTSRSKGLWEYREGNWQRFGSDAKTYIANYNIDSSTTSWATYADAAGVVPVNGTGGVATTTFTFSSSSPLRGSGSGIITKDAANRQGEGISTDFTIDTADQGKVLQLSFDFTTSSAFVAADYRVFLYDVTNSLLIEGNARDLQANAGYGLYIGNFQTSSNSTSYRLILHCATTNASAYTIKVDNFILSPSQVAQGAIVSDWQAFTPTGSHSTNATWTGYYRRVGDTLEMKARVSYSGATNAATDLTINLPSGFTIDTAKLTSTSNQETYLGLARISDASVNEYEGVISYNSTTSVKVRIFVEGAAVAVTATNFTSASPFTIASGDSVSIQAWGIPIVGWSSSITVPSQQSNQVIACRAALSGNQSVSASTVTKVLFATVSETLCYDTAGAFSTGSNRFVAPQAGYYAVTGAAFLSGYTSAERATMSIVKNGTTDVGVGAASEASTFVYVQVNAQIYLMAGEYIEIFIDSTADASYTISDDNSYTYFVVNRISGNQTIGMDEVVGCSYTTNAGQSISNNTLTTVLFEDKVFDTHNTYNTSTGEYTIPVAGKYLVTQKILYAQSNTWAITEKAYALIYVNGVQKAYSINDMPVTSASSIYIERQTSFVFDAVKGDVVTGRTQQVSGGSIALEADGAGNQFSVIRIK